ncbi:MAG: DUF2125 domain-containing protein [Azospirillaceae bacterium]|nr:DUF2125 domain-containing protein [Azospirillaceae bacterium]
MRIRPVTVVLFLVLVLVTGYAVWWHQMAGRLLVLLEKNAAAARGAGATVSYQPPSLGGFPLGITITADQVTVEKPGGLSWSAETVKASAPIWRLDDIALTLAKGGHAALPAEGARPALDVGAVVAGGRVALDLATGVPRSVKVDLDHATVVVTPTPTPAPTTEAATDPNAPPPAPAPTPASVIPAGSYPVDSFSLELIRPAVPPADHTGTGLTLHLDVSGLTVPPVRNLGTTIRRLVVSARVQGPLPTTPTAEAVSPWSKEGGTVELDSLKLDWGDLSLAANATLALDTSLQPQGSGAVEASGLESLMENSNQAAMVRAGMAMLSKPNANGGPPAVHLPITLQNHKLQVGPFTVWHYPTVDWH